MAFNFSRLKVKAKIVGSILRDRVASHPIIIAQSKMLAKRELNIQKAHFLDEVEGHKVSQELINKPNTSSFLLGAGGNIFSFIGFPSEQEPVSELIEVLEDGIQLSSSPPRKKFKIFGVIEYKYRVSIPTAAEISRDQKFKLPWEEGLSWVDGIEKGISGLGAYIYRAQGFGSSVESRSGTGLQAKEGSKSGAKSKTIRSGSFQTTTYLSGLLNDFRKEIRS
jgi:hypothetical protein